MGLSQSQWFDKLKSLYPSWFFEEELYQVAYLQGFALLLSEIQGDSDAHLLETYILEAHNGFLDAQGDERSIDRIALEFDDQYRVRVQNLTNQSNLPAIKRIVDKLLIVGESTVIEDWEALVFFDRDGYLNRGEILIDEVYNCFSIIVDKQKHEPYSFLDREESFCDREFFWGMQESSDYVFSLILEAVNKAKALGVFYRVIERLEG